MPTSPLPYCSAGTEWNMKIWRLPIPKPRQMLKASCDNASAGRSVFCIRAGTAAVRDPGGCLVAQPGVAATLRLPAIILSSFVEDVEACHRGPALRLG